MQCFEEALLFAFGKSLHTLFAPLLIYRKSTDTATIWDLFATHFYDNLPCQLRNWLNIPEYLTNLYHDYDLYLLIELLKESEKTLNQCGLPLPTHIWRVDKFFF